MDNTKLFGADLVPTTKYNLTNPCLYFMGYTVRYTVYDICWMPWTATWMPWSFEHILVCICDMTSDVCCMTQANTMPSSVNLSTFDYAGKCGTVKIIIHQNENYKLQNERFQTCVIFHKYSVMNVLLNIILPYHIAKLITQFNDFSNISLGDYCNALLTWGAWYWWFIIPMKPHLWP